MSSKIGPRIHGACFLSPTHLGVQPSLQSAIPTITVLEAIFHASMKRYGLAALSVTEQVNNSPYFPGDE